MAGLNNIIIDWLIQHEWGKDFANQMGKKWQEELHFQSEQICYTMNKPTPKESTEVTVYIPLPACNDIWTKKAFMLANYLVNHFNGYYNWRHSFDFMKDKNNEKDWINHKYCLAITVPYTRMNP